jgi:hypothetical protein
MAALMVVCMAALMAARMTVCCGWPRRFCGLFPAVPSGLYLRRRKACPNVIEFRFDRRRIQS